MCIKKAPALPGSIYLHRCCISEHSMQTVFSKDKMYPKCSAFVPEKFQMSGAASGARFYPWPGPLSCLQQTQTLKSFPSHWLVTANEDDWLQFLDPVHASQWLDSLRGTRCLGRLTLPPSKVQTSSFSFCSFCTRTLFFSSIFQFIAQENLLLF